MVRIWLEFSERMVINISVKYVGNPTNRTVTLSVCKIWLYKWFLKVASYPRFIILIWYSSCVILYYLWAWHFYETHFSWIIYSSDRYVDAWPWSHISDMYGITKARFAFFTSWKLLFMPEGSVLRPYVSELLMNYMTHNLYCTTFAFQLNTNNPLLSVIWL